MNFETLVIWGSKKIKVNIDISKPAGEFMKTLEALTGVPVSRQKLCKRRQQIKPEKMFKPNEITNETQFMLIGTSLVAPTWTEIPKISYDSFIELIFDINEENIDEIYSIIDNNEYDMKYIINCAIFAKRVRYKQRKPITELIQKLVKKRGTKTLDENKFNPKNIFDESSIEQAIYNDDVESLIKFCGEPGFIADNECNADFSEIETINSSIYPFTYIQLMAYFGSVKCFKFALQDGSFSLGDICDYAVAGGNEEIIKLLEQRNISFKDCAHTAIEFHRNCIYNWIIKTYNLQCSHLLTAVTYYNDQMFLTLAKDLDKSYDASLSFFHAVENGNLYLMKYIEKNFTIDIHSLGKTLLDAALKENNEEIIDFLVNVCHADIGFDHCDNEIVTRKADLFFLIAKSDLETMKKLIEENNFYVNQKFFGKTLLFTVYNIDAIQCLIDEYKADINILDDDHCNLLSWAIKRNYYNLSRFLIEHYDLKIDKSAVFSTVTNNDKLLHYLIENDKIDIYACDNDGNNILHIAVKNRLLELIDYLVNTIKMDANTLNISGQTPLEIAINDNILDVVKFLIKKCNVSVTNKCIFNSINNNNKIMLRYLIENSHFDDENGMFYMFIIHSINNRKLSMLIYFVEHLNANVKNTLRQAIKNSNLKIVKYLVEDCRMNINYCYFSNTHKNDILGYITLLHKLHEESRKGDLANVQMLIEEGYYPLQKFNEMTPFENAVANGHIDVARYLATFGTDTIDLSNDLLTTVNNKDLNMTKFLVDECNASITDEIIDASQNEQITEYLLDKCQLHKACEQNDNNKILSINSSPDLKVNGKTALAIAVENNNFFITKYFIEHYHANIETTIIEKDSNGNYINCTVLHIAARNGNLDICKYLVEFCHADVSIKRSCTVLLFAAQSGNIELVKYFVDYCHANITDFEVENEEIKEFLEFKRSLNDSCKVGDIEKIKYLIETEKFSPDIMVNGKTALHNAIEANNLELTKYLVEVCHAHFVLTEDEFRHSCLELAVKQGSLELTKYLIEDCKVEIDENEKDETSLINFAVKNNNFELVKYLYENCNSCITDYDYKITDNEEISVFIKQKCNLHETFHSTIINRNLCCLKDFVMRNDNFIDRRYNGKTALHVAVENKCLDIVKFLVEDVKFNVDAKNSSGRTALHVAVIKNDIEIVKYLFEKCNARVDIKDFYGRTAIQCASNDVKRYLESKK